MKQLLSICLIIVSMLVFTPAFSQCAMCKASVESNIENDQKAVGKGLNDGIIYLMSIPYLVLGGIGYMVYKNWKSKGSE